MLKGALLYLANNKSLYAFAMRHDILRGLAHRFVAGETLDEGIRAILDLNKRGLLASLDYLGEHVSQPDEARAAAEAYVRTLEGIGQARAECNVSLKLSQMGLDLSEDLALANLRRVVDCAHALGNFVRLDMESSVYTQRTLELFYRLWPERQNMGVVMQAYLYRTADDVERLIRDRVRVRLCKGAYKEPASVAYPAKRDVDENYARLAERLLLDGNYPALATHDERLIGLAQVFARQHDISSERFEFQMLLGIRRDLQERLVQQGYRVRIYVPYGQQWYPYLVRRLAERPANLLFFLRQLFQ